jgi:2-hydroxychromene-2-carboxylate isomerase
MDVYYFPGSLYSALALIRIAPLARAAGVALAWRPFNVRQSMTEQNNIPRSNPIKMKYLWRDLERRCARHGIAYRPGIPFPADPDLLACRVAVVAAEEGWCGELAAASSAAWFAEHRAPHDVAPTLLALGKNFEQVLQRAGASAALARLEENTAAARRLGIFGAPTFVAGEEVFWGDDRLDEALEWAKRR